MNYGLLGATDLKVSALGLGTVELGMPYGLGLPAPPPDAECIALLHRALDLGITYFDTAAVYGRSEELLGRAFAALSTRPVIATKAIIRSARREIPLRGAALARHLEHSARQSLRRLGLEILDLLQIHAGSADSLTIGELFQVMDRLSARGLVRHWGATTYGEEAPLQALEHPQRFRTLQVAYNLLDRRLESRVFPACWEKGVGLVLRSIFLKGALSQRHSALPERLGPLREAARRAGEVAAALGISLSALALRYAAFAPQPHVTLCGTADVGELEADVQAFAAGPLPAAALEQLRAIRVEDETLLNPSNWGL